MKKILLTLMMLLFTSMLFAQSGVRVEIDRRPPIEILSETEINFHEEEIKSIISFYGYNTFVMFDFDNQGPYLLIETEGDYSTYEHTTFVITMVSALMKYSEFYEFDFSKYTRRIDFISGEIESELLREDYIEATNIVNSKEQGAFLNEQRSYK